MTAGKRWWHAYGGLEPDLAEDENGEPSEAHCLMVLAGSKGPDEVPRTITRPSVLSGPRASLVEYTLIATWDHEPTEAEQEAVTPPEYRDDPAGAS